MTTMSPKKIVLALAVLLLACGSALLLQQYRISQLMHAVQLQVAQVERSERNHALQLDQQLLPEVVLHKQSVALQIYYLRQLAGSCGLQVKQLTFKKRYQLKLFGRYQDALSWLQKFATRYMGLWLQSVRLTAKPNGVLLELTVVRA